MSAQEDVNVRMPTVKSPRKTLKSPSKGKKQSNKQTMNQEDVQERGQARSRSPAKKSQGVKKQRSNSKGQKAQKAKGQKAQKAKGQKAQQGQQQGQRQRSKSPQRQRSKSPRSPRSPRKKGERVGYFPTAIIDRAITSIVKTDGADVHQVSSEARMKIKEVFEEYAQKKATALNLIALSAGVQTIMGKTVDAYYAGLGEQDYGRHSYEINLQKPAIKRVLKEGGAKRVSAKAYESLQYYWSNILIHIVMVAASHAQEAKRATIRAEDVDAAQIQLCMI